MWTSQRPRRSSLTNTFGVGSSDWLGVWGSWRKWFRVGCITRRVRWANRRRRTCGFRTIVPELLDVSSQLKFELERNRICFNGLKYLCFRIPLRSQAAQHTQEDGLEAIVGNGMTDENKEAEDKHAAHHAKRATEHRERSDDGGTTRQTRGCDGCYSHARGN